MKDTTAYKIFHDIDFNKFPFSLLKPLKTHLYPITSLFIVETPCAKFYLDDMVKVTNTDEYSLDDLRPDDVVLDIGACIGGFALRVHNQVKKVYAVEPIMIKRLERNIKLNRAKNIESYTMALGDTGDKLNIQTIQWAGYEVIKRVYTLHQIIDICGDHVDFLKLDAEGAEYCIKPEELKGIRRIEAEVHRTKEHECYEFINTLICAGFDYEAVHGEDLMIVHAWRKE